jgi:hypothetical protein
MIITEDLFMSVGEIKYTKLQQLKMGDIKEGFVLVKDRKNPTAYQFVFYDIEDSISKVKEKIDEVNKYIHRDD